MPSLMQVHCWLALLNPSQISNNKKFLKDLPAPPICDVHGMVTFNIPQKLSCTITLKLEQHRSASFSIWSNALIPVVVELADTEKSIRQPKELLGSFSFCFFPPPLLGFSVGISWSDHSNDSQSTDHIHCLDSYFLWQNKQPKPSISQCFIIPVHYWNRWCYTVLQLRFTSYCRLAIFPMRKIFPSNRAVLQSTTTWIWASKIASRVPTNTQVLISTWGSFLLNNSSLLDSLLYSSMMRATSGS